MRYLHLYRLILAALPAGKQAFQLIQGERADAFVNIYRRHRAKGAALAIFDEEGIKTHLVLGQARQGMAVSEDTVFRTASVSKMVTAALVMKLAEEGKVDLDADVDRALPYSLRHPGAPDVPITLRMLLSHTAGIQDGQAYTRALGKDVPAETLLAQDSHTPHLPGMGCEYSNFGVGLAACVLEAALGISFELLAQEWLFEPLGMKASYYPHQAKGTLADAWRILPPAKQPNFDAKARQQAVKRGWDQPDPQAHYSLAQGNCCMDIKSAVKLGQALMKPGFLSEDSLKTMRAPAASLSARDPSLTQGIGTFLMEDKKVSPHPLYGHQGMAYGAVHMLFMDPVRREGMVSFTTAVSEARRYILTDVNKALLRAWQEGK